MANTQTGNDGGLNDQLNYEELQEHAGKATPTAPVFAGPGQFPQQTTPTTDTTDPDQADDITVNFGDEQFEWIDTEFEEPIQEYHVTLLKIFGVISCIIFFPTGIPALVYAFKTAKEYKNGLEIRNLDEAYSYSTTTARLIVCSGFFAIFAGLIIYGVVDRTQDNVDWV